MPNINFNAPVIRLGTTNGPNQGGRGDSGRDDRQQGSGSRPGLGADREQGGRSREPVQTLIPPTPDEKLRTMFIINVPEGLGSDASIHRFLDIFGGLKRWESAGSVAPDYKGAKFGFAVFEHQEPFDMAVRLLLQEQILVPAKRQPGSEEPKTDDDFEGIDKVKLEVHIDPTAQESLDKFRESQGDEMADATLETVREQLQRAIRGLFYPSIAATKADDAAVANAENGDVEVVNIPLGQEDELADIPAELREMVTKEIAAFRDRSIQRDMERLRKEEEMEEIERQRSGAGRRRDPPPSSTSGAPTGPSHRNGFVNGGTERNGISYRRDDDNIEISDEEINRRALAKEQAEADEAYDEVERKWSNRERSRQAALEREQTRDKHGDDAHQRRVDEQLQREKEWQDDSEATKSGHMYHRDHAAWVRKRLIDKTDEEARDDIDRRAEADENRRHEAQMEKAKGQADSFLDQQAQEEEDQCAPAPAAAAVPAQPFKLSLGAAAQKAASSRAVPQRRTIAEVEGLLDNEESETTTRRQLIPIEYDASAATAGMTDEEITQAVRKLAQEIPSDKDGLWAWDVKWDHMDDSVVRDKLRPFVEKKIVEYLGVQEEMLVEAVEEHLRKHGSAADLVEELEGPLDDEAEDLVKKLWRMVIFFTESEKRGLPA